MILLFLDIDGVLNTTEFMLRPDLHAGNHPLDSAQHSAEELQESCINCLNHIVWQTGAKIVITSTWREGRSIRELERILRAGGFDGEVVGKLDDRGGSREAAVFRWIEDSRRYYGLGATENFAVLDDEKKRFDILLDAPSFFYVDPVTGLTPELSSKITNWLLNGE